MSITGLEVYIDMWSICMAAMCMNFHEHTFFSQPSLLFSAAILHVRIGRSVGSIVVSTEQEVLSPADRPCNFRWFAMHSHTHNTAYRDDYTFVVRTYLRQVIYIGVGRLVFTKFYHNNYVNKSHTSHRYALLGWPKSTYRENGYGTVFIMHKTHTTWSSHMRQHTNIRLHNMTIESDDTFATGQSPLLSLSLSLPLYLSFTSPFCFFPTCTSNAIADNWNQLLLPALSTNFLFNCWLQNNFVCTRTPGN